MMLALLVTVLAYHPIASFDESPSLGGGGGNYFTGSPRFKAYDCTICHVDPDERIAVELATEPPELADGSYTPGQIYQVTLRLAGEHAGLGTTGNQNTFMAEIAGDDGSAAGAYVGFDTLQLRLGGGDRVIGARGRGPETEWEFEWRAPAAGYGAATLHVGLVDGNGAGDFEQGRTDPNGDDTAMLALRLCEGQPGCAAPAAPLDLESPAASCSAGGAAGPGGAILVLLALGVRRRPWPWLAALALAGCFDPETGAECPGRVCGDAGATPDAAGSGCQESWVCTPWAAPAGSDQATRTCTDRNQTGTTECKPDEGPTALPALDFEYYQCEVHPIIQRGCGMLNCHGTADDEGRTFRTYTRGRRRNDEIVDRTGTCIPATGQVNLDEAGTGTVMCEGWLPHTDAEWKKSYDSARSFMLGVSNAADSDLLRQPVVGGKPHVDVHLFRDTDADYLTIKAWLEGAALGSCNPGVN
jgi:hypothetical protein